MKQKHFQEEYISPEIQVIALSPMKSLLEGSPDPWGGEGAGDEPTPGF
ncbi:MAG: hypothetical protein J6Z18_09830 [Prevotella sp.]|nr:hypothetical protein [Prevotella sp.]